MPTIGEIIEAIEAAAPRQLQEDYDNSGLQIGDASRPCTGALICVDPTAERIAEAKALECNLVISHHPLLFHGLKQIVGATPQQRAALRAIEAGVAVYSAHTSLDNAPAPWGVSAHLAVELGLDYCQPLLPAAADPTTGAGALAQASEPISAAELVERVKRACDSPVCRCTIPPTSASISRVAICGGAGGSMIADAIAAGAQAYVTSDVRYHDFLDYADRIFIVDIGHYESESCTKRILHSIIMRNFPNFAADIYFSLLERNPINYL